MSGRGRTALERADREARAAAVREFVRPLVLEAGAGTGKTAILVSRLLAWSLGAGWDDGAKEVAGRFLHEGRREEPAPEQVAAAVLDRVVAITFSDAAAAEMAERVAATLVEIVEQRPRLWLDDGSLPSLELRLVRARALLVALDHLVVCTIHAFCRRLLARYPLEAGLHPDFVVDADGLALEEAVHVAVSDFVRRAFTAPGDPQALALASLGISPADIVEALALLVSRGVPASALAHPAYDAAAVGALRRRLLDAIAGLNEAGAGALVGAKRQQIAQEALAAIEETGRLLVGTGAPDVAGLEALCGALQRSWRANLRERLREWGRGQLKQGEAAALGDRAADFVAAAGRLRPALALGEMV